MILIKNYNINYKPKEDYEKQYKMDGQYKNNNVDNIEKNDDKDSIKDEIKEDINTIYDLTDGLPNSIKSIMLPPISGIDYIISDFDSTLDEDNKPGVIITVPDETETNNNINIDSNDLDNIEGPSESNIFPELPDVKIEVIKEPEADIKIKTQFQKDISNIIIDFTHKLKQVLNNYYVCILKTSKDCGITDFKIMQKHYTSKAKKEENMFLSDAIIKNQIVRDQKQRLIKKFFDTDEIILTIRRCKVAEELKARYYKAQYDKNDNFLKLNKNRILSDSRQEYDKKYKENLFGLYKCLNSTVILIDECLQHSLTEFQAKAILLKEEGGID